MAMRPMTATKTLLIWPWYFAMAGTRLMAYMGMRNRMVAMMGPPRGSDHPEDGGGLITATAHRVQDEEGDDEQLDLLVVRGLAGVAHLLDDHPLQAFTGTQVVAEEGGDDGPRRQTSGPK